ncbi:MAG TPA: multicopper oxidase domain-containing protein, partial [Solirubrobacteraceae bacterium]|nr:multicopper oxidase domain-containing protein [Solirubrobacteraceae bacterium]
MTGQDDITRRDALHRMASFALLCSVGGTAAVKPRAVTSAVLRALDGSPFRPFRAELPLIPELRPTRRTRERDVYDVAIRHGTAEILRGFETPILGYDGLYPGPTIRARRGREVLVRQRNALSFDVNVHLHGGVVPAADDGHPMDLIAPGAVRRYRYPNHQGAATLWYHDHAHGRTARSVHRGLAGFYVIEDRREEELELPRGRFDVPLMIQDRAFNRDGSLRYASSPEPGFLGDTILVNGAVAPRMRVRRRLYRFRLLNASNARRYKLVLGGGRPMVQIASDGGLLARRLKRRSIPMSPGERVDIVVDFRDYAPGTELVLHNDFGSRSTVAVMRFDVERGGGAEEARVPRRLRELAPLPAPAVDRRFELSLTTANGILWQIGGRSFDPNRIDVRPRLGT